MAPRVLGVDPRVLGVVSRVLPCDTPSMPKHLFPTSLCVVVRDRDRDRDRDRVLSVCPNVPGANGFPSSNPLPQGSMHRGLCTGVCAL